jgi:O-antigen ligase
MDTITHFVLCLLVFIVPWQGIAVVPYLGTMSYLLGGLALGCAVLSVMLRPMRPLPATLMLLGVFVVWCWTTLIWSVAPELTIRYGTSLVALWIFAWMAWEFARSPRQLQWLLFAYCAGTVLALVTLLVAFRSVNLSRTEEEVRFTGGGVNPNSFAFEAIVAVPILLYLAAEASRRHQLRRYLYWATVPVAALGLFLTGSRGGVLSLIAGIATIFVLSGYRDWRTRLIIVCMAIAGAFLVYAFLPAALLSRLSHSTEVGSSLGPRLELWFSSIAAWIRQPLTGVGFAANAAALAQMQATRVGVAHNVFLSILLGSGLIGLVLFLVPLVMIFRTAWRLPKREKFLWFPVLIMWLVTGLSTNMETDKTTWFVFSMVLAFSAAAHEAAVQQRKELRRASVSGETPLLRGRR